MRQRSRRGREKTIPIDDRSDAGTSQTSIRLSIADRIVDIIDGREPGVAERVVVNIELSIESGAMWAKSSGLILIPGPRATSNGVTRPTRRGPIES